MQHRIRSLLGAAAFWLLVCCAVPAQGAGAWTWPVRGEVLTPYRNGNDPYAAGQHRGVDLAAPVGARVVAAVAGTVRFAGVAGSSGLTVSLRTTDARFDTSYLHLATAAVRAGDRVAAGDGLGTVGTSGRRSTAQPHLHFGVREAGSRHAYRNPLEFLPPLPPVSTPDAPPGAPLPVRSPVHTAPAPVRVPEPAPRGSHRTVPARRPLRQPVPAGRRVRVPAGHPVGVPAAGRVTVGSARPVTGAPHRSPGQAPYAAVSPGPVRAPGLGPARPEAGATDAPARDSRAARGAAHAEGGPDLGWALACVGLLAAAACIGLGKNGDRPGRERPDVRALMRPLLGGRRQ